MTRSQIASKILEDKSTLLQIELPEKDTNDKFVLLQKISREHNLETYPNTGILDLYFELYTKQRSLFDELKTESED